MIKTTPKKPVTTEEIKQVAKKIADRFNPEKIIVYGSYVWGKPDENSDVDFFIVKETDDPWGLVSDISGYIYPRPFPMDVLVYPPELIKKSINSGNFFIRNIVSKGKIVYAKK